MNKIHTTKDGIKIPIFEMEDAHILATIVIFCNNIKSFRLRLDEPKEIRKSDKILYGDGVISENEASNKLVSLTDKLAAYVFEAAIRGLNISAHLQDAYGRKTNLIIDQKVDF